MSDTQCFTIKKDNTQCKKKGTEYHNENYYCKVHFNLLSKSEDTISDSIDDTISDSIDDKEEEFIEKSNEDEIEEEEIFETDSEDEKDETTEGKETKKDDKQEQKKSNKKDINICNGIKKDKSQCDKKGSELHNKLHYCKVHLKQIIKLENIHICNGIKKDKTQCDKKSTEFHNDIHYCKIHLKQIIKLENINLCNGIKKDDNKCVRIGTEFHNNTYYCKAHLKEKINDVEKTNKKESRNLLNTIHKFIKISSDKFYTEEEYVNIKKEYKNIMLKIHPDKCKYSNLDSTELSKKINMHMDKIKKYG